VIVLSSGLTEHEHDQSNGRRPYRSEHLRTAASRARQIQENQVERFRVETKERILTGPLDGYLIAVRREPFAQCLGDLRVVLGDENPKGRRPACGCSTAVRHAPAVGPPRLR
jgi:hypothetical protein